MRPRLLLGAALLSVSLLGLGAEASAADADFSSMGNLSVPAITLGAECASYAYGYHVSPPTGDWALEITVTAPYSTGVASDVVISGADGTSGTKSFQLCPTGTPTGGYTMAGRLTYKDYPDQFSGWITPATFTVSSATAAQTAAPASARCSKARAKAKRLHTRKAHQRARRICRRG